MTVFADSSAVVKLYVPEEGYETVRSIDAPLVISNVARVEVPAAFWGKVRTGELAVEDADTLVRAFEYDFHGGEVAGPTFAVVSCSDALLVEAARHAARHGLRAYDSVQLASAVAARQAEPSIRTIAVFDKGLRTAALAEGFAVL